MPPIDPIRGHLVQRSVPFDNHSVRCGGWWLAAQVNQQKVRRYTDKHLRGLSSRDCFVQKAQGFQWREIHCAHTQRVFLPADVAEHLWDCSFREARQITGDRCETSFHAATPAPLGKNNMVRASGARLCVHVLLGH